MEELRDQIAALQKRVHEKEQEFIVIQQDLNILRARLEDALSEKRVEELKAEQEERLKLKAKQEAEMARRAAEETEKAQLELEAKQKAEEEAKEASKIDEETSAPAAPPLEEEEIEITQVNEAQHEAIMRTIEEMSNTMGIGKNEGSNPGFQAKPTLGDKVSQRRINDIKRGIGINERFLYANELFAGDMSAFSQAVEELNHVDSETDANRLLNENLAMKYRWDEENETVLAFKSLVSRRFA